LIAAQAFLFFAAGFETSSTTLSFCLLELAINPQIQQRLCIEIDTTLGKCKGLITYDAIQSMTYLDKVVNGESFDVLESCALERNWVVFPSTHYLVFQLHTSKDRNFSLLESSLKLTLKMSSFQHKLLLPVADTTLTFVIETH
jgi:hypothetical protein